MTEDLELLNRYAAEQSEAAFLGSQADIDSFLQQVDQSNQRIVQQAGSFLTPSQVATLDAVLTKAIDSRRLQGAAFFQNP